MLGSTTQITTITRNTNWTMNICPRKKIKLEGSTHSHTQRIINNLIFKPDQQHFAACTKVATNHKSILVFCIIYQYWDDSGNPFSCKSMTSSSSMADIIVFDIELAMMTSSNGSIFHVTGPLCGEFTGPGEFPAQRPVTQSFDVFFDLHVNKWLSKQPQGWWLETPLWSLWRHRNAM